jgi:hypothetical protein
MSRLDKEKQLELEPKRFEFASDTISNLGFDIFDISLSSFSFFFRGEKVTIFPYSGWHTGKSIKDGRGIKNLIKQIKNG